MGESRARREAERKRLIQRGDPDMTSTEGTVSFLDAVNARIEDILDTCTRCGRCVEACPMVEPAGLDKTQAPAIVGGILDLLAGGPGTPDAERWTQVCTNSGKCMPACDYGVNPRFMVNMARVAAKAKLGEDAVRRAGQTYLRQLHHSTRMISRLLLTPEELERLAPPLRERRRLRERSRHRALHGLQHHQDASHPDARARSARRDRRYLRSDGRRRDLLRHPALQGGRREDRGAHGIQHDRAPEPPRGLARDRVVPELPHPDRRGRAPRVQGIVRSEAFRHRTRSPNSSPNVSTTCGRSSSIRCANASRCRNVPRCPAS